LSNPHPFDSPRPPQHSVMDSLAQPVRIDHHGQTGHETECRKAMEDVADWYGRDPYMTKLAMEAASFVFLHRFESPEAWARAIKEHVELLHGITS
jgi:hypothetical protein